MTMERVDNASMKSKTYRLPAEQIVWLEGEARRLGESENTIIRLLIRTAMQGAFGLAATLTPEQPSTPVIN